MEFFNIINAEKRGGDNVMTSIDPRTKEKLWNAPVAVEADLNDAVLAARNVFKTWKFVPVEERQKCLSRLADELDAQRAEIHAILSKETGKSVCDVFKTDECLLKIYACRTCSQISRLTTR